MSHSNKVKDTIIALKKKHAESPWKNVLYKIFDSEEFSTALFQLMSDVEANQMFTPVLKNLFKNLELCKPNAVNVVFINANPEPQKGIADGLAFSTSVDGSSHTITGFHDALSESSAEGPRADYNLEYLVKQGVLLWNVALTCPIGKPMDHIPMWEPISRMFLGMLSQFIKNIVFVFVGEETEKLNSSIHNGNFKLFLPEIPKEGNWNNIDCFKAVNQILEKQKKHPIMW